MPITIKDYYWNQNETTLFVNLPLKGTKSTNVDILNSQEYCKASWCLFFIILLQFLFIINFICPFEGVLSTVSIWIVVLWQNQRWHVLGNDQQWNDIITIQQIEQWIMATAIPSGIRYLYSFKKHSQKEKTKKIKNLKTRKRKQRSNETDPKWCDRICTAKDNTQS